MTLRPREGTKSGDLVNAMGLGSLEERSAKNQEKRKAASQSSNKWI